MTPKLKNSTNELRKRWKLAWYHHFTHIACCKKLRGLWQKLDALRVQNGQSLSKYQGFGRKLICYKGISFFLTYFNSRLFVCSTCTIQCHIKNFQPFLTSFAIFHAFTDFFEQNDPEIEKQYKWTLKMLKVGMVSSFHPHSMLLKSWEGYGKNWMHFVYKMDKLFRSIRVSDENSYVTKAFHVFLLISTPDFLCVQHAPFKATSSIFNPFWLHLLFFMHLLIFLS